MGQLSAVMIFGAIIAYFLVLVGVSYFTSRNANNQDFFLASRQSPWYLVAFGMIGASLSGVTFISVPGKVGGSGVNMAFSYMQVVLGYLLGYFVIAKVLLPIYYERNLTSIYTYLEQRFGFYSYKTGAAFFLLSRTIGAAFRLYLVAISFQTIFELTKIDVPFWITVMVTILLIWVYTFRGGIKTIVWTDSLQTFFMLLAVGLTIGAIGNALEVNVGELIGMIQQSDYSRMFFFTDGFDDGNNFFMQFFSGAMIAIAMTGLDQDMMQKNLSCRTLKESQLNIFVFSIILVIVNLVFLGLGALLYIYAANIGLEVPAKTDTLFPLIALGHLTPVISIVFILGLIAAAYSSADSALTALTTSFCIDFLDIEKKNLSEQEQKSLRFKVHLGFSFLLLLVILAFNALSNDAVITQIFIWAGYTYGPLVGLFFFGILTDLKIRDRWVIPVCVAAPLIAFGLNYFLKTVLNINIGLLIILVNGLISFFGLLLISTNQEEDNEAIFE